MKTIRQSAFETNSSSTHSLTIHNKEEMTKYPGYYESDYEILIDNVLYPHRYHGYENSELQMYNRLWLAATRNQKLSLLIKILYNHVFDQLPGFFNDELVPDSDYQELWSKLMAFICQKTGLSGIVYPEQKYDSGINYTDMEDFDFNSSIGMLHPHLDRFPLVERFIEEYIMDESKVLRYYSDEH